MQLPGVITGKQLNNGMYVPTIYSKSQSEWVDNFYKQNGYIGELINVFVYLILILLISY